MVNTTLRPISPTGPIARPVSLVLPALCLLLAGSPALADDPPPVTVMDFTCDGEHLTQVLVDGIQSDWEEEARPTERVGQMVEGAWRYDWTGPVDASFKIWCRYTDHGLYFAVVGRDNEIVEPRGGEDGDLFELMIAVETADGPRPIGVRLPLWDLDEGAATPVWAPGVDEEGEVRAARGMIGPREGGYFLEFNLPYIASDAFDMPFAPIRFFAAHRDLDYDTRGEEVAIVATAPYDRDDPSTWSQLSFTGPDRAIRGIVFDLGAADPEPAVRHYAHVGGTAASELAMVLDDQLVVAGEGFADFTWTSVSVSENDDYTPISIASHDIDRDGDDELFYRYSRRRRSIDLGGSMLQEFVAVYDLRGTELVRIIHQEVANELPDGTRFEMELEFRERSDRHVVRFRKPRESTMSADAWADVDEGDPDVQPALLPWGSRDRIDYDIAGDGSWVVLPAE